MHPKGNVLVFLLVTIVAAIFAIYIVIENTSSSYLNSFASNKTSITKGTKILSPDELAYQYSGNISGIREYKLEGKINTSFTDGSFTVFAKIYGLPDPQQSHKYYAWLGKRGETGQITYINVGEVSKNNDHYVNVFQGASDISNHIFYAISEESDSLLPTQPTITIGESILAKNEIQPTPKKN